MMKTHRYHFLTLALIALTFLFSGQALAADIDATLPDSDDTSSFQVKNSESTNNILLKVQSGGNVKIGVTNSKLVFPGSHYGVKIELFEGGDEKIGTADNQLQFIAGSGTTDNIAFFGDSTEVMRVETDTGNVGIGKTPGAYKLDVNGNVNIGNGGYLNFQNGNPNIQSPFQEVTFQVDTDGNNPGAGIFNFMEYDTFRMKIVGENVGIADTTPDANLEVVNDFYVSSTNAEVDNGNLFRVQSDGKVGIGATLPTEKLDIDSDAIRIRSSQTPASATTTCDAGTIAWDSTYIYICVATDTWKKAEMFTW